MNVRRTDEETRKDIYENDICFPPCPDCNITMNYDNLRDDDAPMWCYSCKKCGKVIKDKDV